MLAVLRTLREKGNYNLKSTSDSIRYSRRRRVPPGSAGKRGHRLDRSRTMLVREESSRLRDAAEHVHHADEIGRYKRRERAVARLERYSLSEAQPGGVVGSEVDPRQRRNEHLDTLQARFAIALAHGPERLDAHRFADLERAC